MSIHPSTDRPRNRHASPLFQLVETHYDELKAVWEDRFEKTHGFWRGFPNTVVARYLDYDPKDAERVVPSCYGLVSPALGWTHLHKTCILMHMRTTLNLDDSLLREAQRLSGLREKTAVVHAGLKALIARQSALRLAALGGTEPKLRTVPRRRMARRR
jgi:Arc/MetJ family transcription regulator